MKYYETTEFKKLNRKWKKKLKADGFKDIEISEDELVRYSFHLTQAYLSGTYDYYLRATEFLNNHKFKTECHKYIWELHSEGKSVRQISAVLANHDYFPHLTPDTIHKRIVYLEQLMLKKAG